MLRRIWNRAAALALPITLAICLPPLAVIALNLHAQSAASRHAGASAHVATQELEKNDRAGTLALGAARRIAAVPGKNQSNSSRD